MGSSYCPGRNCKIPQNENKILAQRFGDLIGEREREREREGDLRFRRKEWSRESSSSRIREEEGSHDVLIVEVLTDKTLILIGRHSSFLNSYRCDVMLCELRLQCRLRVAGEWKAQELIFWGTCGFKPHSHTKLKIKITKIKIKFIYIYIIFFFFLAESD